MPNEPRVQKIRALVDVVSWRRRQAELHVPKLVSVFVINDGELDGAVKLALDKDTSDEKFVVCLVTDDDQTVERAVGDLFDGNGKSRWLTMSAAVSTIPKT